METYPGIPSRPSLYLIAFTESNYSSWVGFVVFGCVFAALYSAVQKHNQTPQTTPG
jgi:hypothetical protein